MQPKRFKDWRMACVFGCTLLVYGALLVQVTILHLWPTNETMDEIHSTQTFINREFPARRGKIMDRTGTTVLAMDVPVRKIAADPKYIHRKGTYERVRQVLINGLGHETETVSLIEQNLNRTNSQYEVLNKAASFQIGETMKLAIKQNALPRGGNMLAGLIVKDGYRRTYPIEGIMSQILGGVNTASKGISGVEYALENILSGRNGVRVGRVNALQREIVHKRDIDVKPTPGANVHLTIHKQIQCILENATNLAMETNNASAAWAVMMDTRSGEILGMASKPDFNMRDAASLSGNSKLRHIGAVSIPYEPGSVIKPIVVAAALNAGVIRSADGFNCHNGYWPEWKLHDVGRSEWLNIEGILVRSSNIGTAKIALRLGKENLFHSLQGFGFGQTTGLGLGGEQRCPMTPFEDWYPIRTTRVAIGQGVLVTSLQVLNGINCIANGGKLMQPQLIKRIESHDGTCIHEARPTLIRQPIRPEVARQVREMMEQVVSHPKGSGRHARLEQYTVAGKTGTAQKWVNGEGYSKELYTASFVGFLPAEDPAFSLIVVIDEPKGEKMYGGQIAAPIWKRIASEAARVLGVPFTTSVVAHHDSEREPGAPRLGGRP